MSEANVVIADAQVVVREGLKALLDAVPSLRIVGESDNGVDVLQKVAALRPNVIIISLMLPGISGLDVIKQVRSHYRDIKILVFTTWTHEAYVREALSSGATGYLLKIATSDEIIEAVRQVAQGKLYISESIAHRVQAIVDTKANPAISDGYEALTNRERDVFQLAALGNTCAELAKQLFISPRTAETHLAHIKSKLALHNQSDIILYAFRRGILTLED